jgi:hypothetical protein
MLRENVVEISEDDTSARFDSRRDLRASAAMAMRGCRDQGSAIEAPRMR